MRRIVALGLVLVVGLAGCGGGDDGDGVATAGGKPTASSSGGPGKPADAREAARQFGKCMRENGVPDFEDPEVSENGELKMHLNGGPGMSREKVDAAQEKCKKYLPNGGEPQKADPKFVEQQRKYAQCMRENGVPNFPDPNPDGGLQLDSNKLGMTPDDPRFKAAEKKCQDVAPKPRNGDKPQLDSREEG